MMTTKHQLQEQQQQQHLLHLLENWTLKQRRILTADGRADEYYCEERGFPFAKTELPHYHLINNTTSRAFREWRGNKDNALAKGPIVGAWNRPLFCGGWEHSTDNDERVYNLQTNTLFVDLRIPISRDVIFNNKAATATANASSLEDLNSDQLRYYARQHVFAGYSRLTFNNNNNTSPFVASCVRHHCIDWNFVGTPRSRPNKWWIELQHPSVGRRSPNAWKEWAYATDLAGQHYYCERWERHNNNTGTTTTTTTSPVVALRKRDGRDGVLVVVGDHFNYCLERQLPEAIKERSTAAEYDQAGSLISLVDEAISRGDGDTARAWLSTEGCHGRIVPSRGWIIDCAIEFWKEGTTLWTMGYDDDVHVVVEGDSISDCCVMWKGEAWDVFESSLTTVGGLKRLLAANADFDQKEICRSRL